jgi:hypothetical protein
MGWPGATFLPLPFDVGSESQHNLKTQTKKIITQQLILKTCQFIAFFKVSITQYKCI